MNVEQRNITMRGARGIGAHSGSQELAKSLGWFSIGLGLAELLAAKTLCRAIGLEGRERIIRAYGVRELATGAAILTSHDPTPWIWGRAGGDALDLATLASGSTEDLNGSKAGLGLAIVAVTGVALLDLYCASNLSAEKRIGESISPAFDYGDRSGFPRPTSAMRGAAKGRGAPSA